MRILCLNPYLPPPLGGIEKEMLAVGGELASLGHDVTVLATDARFPRGRNPAAPDGAGMPRGVRAIRARGWLRSTLRGFSPSRAPLLVPALKREALAARPELVLVFNVGWGPALVPVLAGLNGSCPVLYRSYYHPPGGRLSRYKVDYLMRTLARADRVLAATEQERLELIANGRVDSQRVVVLPPGVHLYPEDPAGALEQAEQYDLLGRVVIAHVARLSEFKGTLDLVAALPTIRARSGRDVVLLLIGADQTGGELDRLIVQTGTGEHVRCTGEIRDDRKLHGLLRCAQVFALPSAYEAFGIAYVEALAEGVPCVGCDVGGVREAIGDAGVILDEFGDRGALADALVDLVLDGARRRQLGELGRRRVLGGLTWRHTAEGVLRVARGVSRAPRGGP